jgi:MFS transporter, DHA2 family, metal-tetracycline-proton antiporter
VTAVNTRPDLSPRSAGLRLGLLFGPVIFGVSAAGVALPSAGVALGVGPSTTAWILTVHALALGVGTALFGRLLDSWGARRVLLTGALVMTTGSAVILLAPGVDTVVVGRFLLATGSGAMSATAVTLSTAGEPQRRIAVLGWYGLVVPVFAGSATLVGGTVTAALSWRWALVLPVLSLVGALLSVRLASGPRRGGRVDVVGATLLTVTTAAGLVLLQAPALDLGTGAVVGLGVLTLAAAGALAGWVRRRPGGFVPRALLARRGYVRAALTGFGVFGGLFASVYAAPVLLVGDRGWTVLAVGAALLPGAALGAVVARLAGRLGPRAQQLLLAVVAAGSAIALATSGATGAPALVLTGTSLAFVAFGVAQVVLSGQAAAAVPPPERGSAMGLLNLTFLVGGAVGSAAAGGLTAPLGVGPALAVAAVLPLAAAVLAGRSSR